MIDDYTKAMALVEKMKTQLPIPIFPKYPLFGYYGIKEARSPLNRC